MVVRKRNRLMQNLEKFFVTTFEKKILFLTFYFSGVVTRFSFPKTYEAIAETISKILFSISNLERRSLRFHDNKLSS